MKTQMMRMAAGLVLGAVINAAAVTAGEERAALPFKMLIEVPRSPGIRGHARAPEANAKTWAGRCHRSGKWISRPT